GGRGAAGRRVGRHSFRHPELVTSLLCSRPSLTRLEVVVHQTHGLHEGIHRGRPDKLPPALFQFLRQRGGFGRRRRDNSGRHVGYRGSITPHEGRKRSFLLNEL